MSNQNNFCDPTNPAPVEYSEVQINAALDGSGPFVNSIDWVGHGSVTTGIAAGNGRAFANGKYRGIAPEADLVIVKYTSEGAPAHDGRLGIDVRVRSAAPPTPATDRQTSDVTRVRR